MEAAGKSDEAARWREEKDRNKGDTSSDCPKCREAYEDTRKRPCILPCTHIFCTLCIGKLEEHGQVDCPECSVSHAVPEGGQFPICYPLEDVIRTLRDLRTAAATAEAQPTPSAGKRKKAARAADHWQTAGRSSKRRPILKEQEDRAEKAITICQEVQSQLRQYLTKLEDWNDQQQELEKGLQGLLDKTSRVRTLIKDEQNRAEDKRKQARKEEVQLHATLQTLRAPTAQHQASVAATDKMFTCTVEAEEVVEECRKIFPDACTVSTVLKAIDESSAVLKDVQAIPAAVETHPTDTGAEPRPQSDSDLRPQSDPDLRPQSQPHYTIMDRLWAMMEPKWKVMELRNQTPTAKRQVELGQVFAVHKLEDQSRHAKISLDGSQFYLHTLKKDPLPPGATTLQVNMVVPQCSPWHVFLDLSGTWKWRNPQRVKIHMRYDTPAARQFMLLCTGQRGASYAKTTLLRKWKNGMPGEYVRVGDYENSDGKSAAALLPKLAKTKYRSSGKAGAVRLLYPKKKDKGAHFAITTRDLEGDEKYNYIFGKVVDGLEELVNVADDDIKSWTVVDCGVLL